jgi:UDP-N-acetylglucosamine:LPS N-acetylglucosamine transferase
VLLPESQLMPAALADELCSLFAERKRLAAMSVSARRLALPNAASEIAEIAARLSS